ncbi:MAG: hypothetical protein AB7O26_01290 [Planctomycetaceae bacterium]
MILRIRIRLTPGARMILASTAAIYLACAAALAGEIQHDPYDGAVEVVAYTFETNEDLDFDGQPDGWTRRKGENFPNYVKAEIDEERGHGTSKRSLKFEVNGGAAVMYSPPVHIDSLHAFVFRCRVRTQALQNNAAVISISLLNSKRQRIQRVLSSPVTGSHSDWVEISLGPIAPLPDVRLLSIGCHLVPGKGGNDIRGAIWFDDLWVGKVPQLSLGSNFQTQFREPNAKVKVAAHATGLDPQRTYTLHLEMFDANEKSVASAVFPLVQPKVDAAEGGDQHQPAPRAPEPVQWELPAQPHGYYEVRALLKRDGVSILDNQTSFAVMDRFEYGGNGEFGWAIDRADPTIPLDEIADVARQAGINWLKFPLWQAVHADDQEFPRRISDFFETLTTRNITPVGLLNCPPSQLRNQFARDWSGVSEIFTMPPSFWYASIEKVVARYSSQVRHWQLGGDDDASFIGMDTLPATVATVKAEFDRIGRDTRIGIHWDWQTPMPTRAEMPGSFLSIDNRTPLNGVQLAERLKATAAADQPRWVLLKPLPKTDHTPEERGSDLVKRMVAAKIGGAEAIFAANIFDPDTGLLQSGGSPRMLFLPWRTTALALQGAEYLGSFVLPEESENHVFARRDEAVVVIWNKIEVEEDIFLGENAVVMDVLGRKVAASAEALTGRAKLKVGPSPLVVRNCSEPLARWRLALQFEKGGLPSKTGKQKESILGVNTFPQGVSGTATLKVPDDWRVEPTRSQFTLAASEKFVIPFAVELPSNTSLGRRLLSIDFELSGQAYPFRVYRPYQVGLGDVLLQVVDMRMESGDLQIKQIIINNTSPLETLNFECNLFVPNRKRQLKKVTKLGNGKDTQLYIVPGADEFRGQELRLRARQIGGLRVLNYRWIVGENWDKPNGSAQLGP